jgi:hypothetical protein
MRTAQTLIGVTLVFCWATLLSARCLAAGMGSGKAGVSYHAVLEHIGILMPFCAWSSLVIGGMVLFVEFSCGIGENNDQNSLTRDEQQEARSGGGTEFSA